MRPESAVPWHGGCHAGVHLWLALLSWLGASRCSTNLGWCERVRRQLLFTPRAGCAGGGWGIARLDRPCAACWPTCWPVLPTGCSITIALAVLPGFQAATRSSLYTLAVLQAGWLCEIQSCIHLLDGIAVPRAHAGHQKTP